MAEHLTAFVIGGLCGWLAAKWAKGLSRAARYWWPRRCARCGKWYGGRDTLPLIDLRVVNGQRGRACYNCYLGIVRR